MLRRDRPHTGVVPRLQPVDVDFFVSAPQRRSHVLDLPVSPERVWRGLTASNPLWWCRVLSVEHTTPRPYGVGTARRTTVLGVLRLRERFFRWEAGRRQSCWVDEANLPLFRRFAQDCLVEPATGGCRFTWAFAWEPAGHLGTRVATAVLDSLAADTRRHFAG